MSQCERLIQAIRCSRRRGMTYGELQALRISTAPHKRLMEGAHLYLKPHERLARIKRGGLVAFVVARKGC